MSRPCEIQRGTKQGDPLSALLLSSLIETVASKVKQKWPAKGWGLKMGFADNARLTNLRFADDALLVAATSRLLEAAAEDIKSQRPRSVSSCARTRRRC